jgi:hypothetical protein
MEEFRSRRRASRENSTSKAVPMGERTGDSQDLGRRMLSASEPEHWLEVLRLSMATWKSRPPSRVLQRDFQFLERRLETRPEYVTILLGHMAVRHPRALKVLLLQLDLLPSDSWLRRDAETQEASRLRGSRAYPSESLQDSAELLHSRFRFLMRARNSNFAPSSEELGRGAWESRLRLLPAIFVPVLRDPSLGDAQFLFLTEQLGFHAEGYPR